MPELRPPSIATLAWRQTLRDFRAGELRLLALAVSVGERLSGVIAYEMAGGHKLYGSLEAQLDSMAGVFNSMQHLLAQPVLAFNLPGGGATYINPINLVGITLHPGLESLPRGSLSASLVE